MLMNHYTCTFASTCSPLLGKQVTQSLSQLLWSNFEYRRGELLLAVPGQDLKPYWKMLLPFSYAIVSGAVGSCSVLFAKSLWVLLSLNLHFFSILLFLMLSVVTFFSSNLLRLSLASGYQLHSWFTYSMLLLFLSTAGFWVNIIHLLVLINELSDSICCDIR